MKVNFSIINDAVAVTMTPVLDAETGGTKTVTRPATTRDLDSFDKTWAKFVEANPEAAEIDIPEPAPKELRVSAEHAEARGWTDGQELAHGVIKIV